MSKINIEMIEINRIHILNPRVRNKKVFKSIAENIDKVGLKRPITVRKSSGTFGKDYDLICGQGRLEAFIEAGQKTIPAIISNATEEQALIMSLVENIARRQHTAMDILKAVEILSDKGYSTQQIVKKTGLTHTHVSNMLYLLKNGESRLIMAVESGQIPITLAVTIAETPNENMQKALQEAYENGQLKGRQLMYVKRLIEKRKRHGKREKIGQRGGVSGKITGHALQKIYQKEVDRKLLITRKAELASNRMLFIIAALRKLLKEENFNNLLRAENIDTLPKQLMELVYLQGKL